MMEETIRYIEPQQLHEEMKRLRYEEQMDFLESLTGMDWGLPEEGDDANAPLRGLGVVYHLESTITGQRMVVRTSTLDREKPEIPSVTDLWKGAELPEREAFDFFGILFIGHPDMRRLFLRNDWVGYPLRKDNDPTQENPLRMNNEETLDKTYELGKTADGNLTGKETVLFGDDEYVVNIGPQHPATHGVLRFRVSLEGENIHKIDVNCGYIHRGIEKMNESLTYPQTLALTDRLDYLGATTAFLYGFRDREKVLDIFEETCGGRLILNYNTIGGVQADIHPNFIHRVKEFIPYLRHNLQEYHDIFTGNIIAQQRLKGIGILSREDAISFGATGGTGRASGWACDVRKRRPYAAYDKVNFREIVRTEGDCFARYMVRMDEIEESLSIIEQLIDNIPEGSYQEKTKPIIRVPEGAWYTAVEGSRGEFGVYLESRGDKTPYRLHYRATGLPLVGTINTITRGAKIADLIAIGGTLDYVVPDIDR